MTIIISDNDQRGHLSIWGSTNYATLHTASSAGAVVGWTDPLARPCPGHIWSKASNTYAIYRGLVAFDTSSLSGYSIISAKLRTRAWKFTEMGIDYDIYVVRGDFSLPPVVSDYGTLLDETEARGSINTASFTTGDVIDISLNAIGISEINKSGWTKFAFRTSREIDALPPTKNGQCLDYTLFCGTSDWWEIQLIVEVAVPSAPQVMTLPAANVSIPNATLNAQVQDDGSESCEGRFRYRRANSEDAYTYTEWANGLQTDDTFLINLTDLEEGNNYEFAAQLRNSIEGEWGDTLYIRFPIAKAIYANSIGQAQSTLVGILTDDAGSPCEYRFRYRRASEAYSYTAWANGKITNDIFSNLISGLSEATLYEFAAQARNPAEGQWSASKYFMTLSPRKTVATEDKVTLELIRNIEICSGGRAYVDKEGNFHYDSRYARNP